MSADLQLREELFAWKLAALESGLYQADTDVSTAAKWKTAQVNAASRLLARCDRVLALEKKIAVMSEALQNILYLRGAEENIIAARRLAMEALEHRIGL